MARAIATAVPEPATRTSVHVNGPTLWWWAAVVLLPAVLLGLHAWRAYDTLRDAVPDPLREAAFASRPFGQASDGGPRPTAPIGPTTPTPLIASTIFVPDCATTLVVRFDPDAAGHGEVTIRLARQQPGNQFIETPPLYETSGRLESMPGGVWTLHPPMEPLRARFVRITLEPASDARGAVLLRAPASRGRARASLDDRWGSRPSLLAGARTAHADPLACVAAGEPLPRALVLPGALFLGMVWALTLIVVAMWLGPRPRARAPAQARAPRPPASSPPA